MAAPPAAAQPKPCCVCGDEGGKHCTLCKSRHYCGKKCQVVDWKERGHKEACKRMAKEFSDRLLDELMPAKLKIKEEPPIVDNVAPADGATAAVGRAPVQTTAIVKAIAPKNDAPDWRGTCAICFDELPLGAAATFYPCCSKKLCTACGVKCWQHDNRCPLCRAPACTSDAEQLRRLQKHVDKGNAEAQNMLGDAYCNGQAGLKKSAKRAFQLYQLAAAQGHAPSQTLLGLCFGFRHGAKIDYKSAAQWYRRAAEQGHPIAQLNLGQMFRQRQGRDAVIRRSRAVVASRRGAGLARRALQPRRLSCKRRRCASTREPLPRGTPRLWPSANGSRPTSQRRATAEAALQGLEAATARLEAPATTAHGGPSRRRDGRGAAAADAPEARCACQICTIMTRRSWTTEQTPGGTVSGELSDSGAAAQSRHDIQSPKSTLGPARFRGGVCSRSRSVLVRTLLWLPEACRGSAAVRAREPPAR
jgi:hypothetical protein